MKLSFLRPWLPVAWLLGAGTSLVLAYPPAPHHLFYGTVRDELGNPLTTAAEVIFECSSGVRLTAPVRSGEPGLNYRLPVPLDAGITDDLYKPTALRPTVPFRFKVRIDSTIYLPIEMSGDYRKLGLPGQRTRLDLTLGQDADADGLPDAWEKALLVGNESLADITPQGDADQDGLSNLDEYLAGTYGFDSQDGFALTIVSRPPGAVRLRFMVVRGRTYTVQGSSDLINWETLEFMPVGAANDNLQTSYFAGDTRVIEVELNAGDMEDPVRVYRLVLE